MEQGQRGRALSAQQQWALPAPRPGAVVPESSGLGVGLMGSTGGMLPASSAAQGSAGCGGEAALPWLCLFCCCRRCSVQTLRLISYKGNFLLLWLNTIHLLEGN